MLALPRPLQRGAAAHVGTAPAPDRAVPALRAPGRGAPEPALSAGAGFCEKVRDESRALAPTRGGGGPRASPSSPPTHTRVRSRRRLVELNDAHAHRMVLSHIPERTRSLSQQGKEVDMGGFRPFPPRSLPRRAPSHAAPHARAQCHGQTSTSTSAAACRTTWGRWRTRRAWRPVCMHSAQHSPPTLTPSLTLRRGPGGHRRGPSVSLQRGSRLIVRYALVRRFVAEGRVALF